MQYHTAPSREIEMSENPKLSNIAQSATQQSVSLRLVKQFLFYFQNLIFPGLLESMC